jgi:hypothetical protein
MRSNRLNSKKLLDEYRGRFKEQIKYQLLLMNATEIFGISDESELFRELHKLCRSSISCEAIAWFSDSLKLTPNNFKIKTPENWPGWSQNSWDWLDHDSRNDDISSDDGKNDYFAICFQIDIESMGNSEAEGKTQKEYLLFVLKKSPKLYQDKSREELLGVISKQFYMARRVEKSTKYLSFLQSKRQVFAKSLCQGSRTAILKHGEDLLKFTELEGDQKDFVNAVKMDAEIQLGIVPSQRPNFSLKAEELAKNETEKEQVRPEIGNSIDPDQKILTYIVNLRKEAWKTRRESKSIEEKLKCMKKHWGRAKKYCPPREFQNGIEVKAKKATIEQKLLSGLQKHYYIRMGRVEFLRTQLFVLYCSASGLKEVADTHNISNCDRVCFDNIIGKKNLFSLLIEELSCFLAKWQKNKDSPLNITSEWLACWFGVRFLEDIPWDNFKQDSSPGERAIFFKHFAAYYLYLLHCIRNFGMPSLFRFSDVKGGHEVYLHAAIFLLSEYAHQVCMFSRRIALYRTLMHAWSSEAILYIVRSSYRDHIFHVLNVCLLGMVLIEAGLVDRLTESSELEDEKSKNTMMNWILAGLLHDVGYCIGLNRHILFHTAFLRSSPGIRDFQENLQKNYTELEKALIVSLNKETKEFDCGNMKAKLDHGVVSAMHLLYLDQVHLEDKMGNAPKPGWKEQTTSAFRAMAMHNLKDEVKIDPSKDPLSFLLLLCDHIQEWDRPRVDSLRLRRFVTSALQSPRPGSLDSSTIVRYLKADLSWNQKDKKMTPILSKDSLELSLHYKDSGDEQFEPAWIWCKNSYDFEKVVFDNWPQNFHLVFKTIHPVSTKLRIEKKKGGEKEEKGEVVIEYAEMDLLQDYLRETGQEAFLATWISKSRKCDSWVKYHLAENEETEKEEVFETVFEHISDKHEKLILHLPPNFYRDYVKWKKQRLYDAELYCRS